MFETEERAPRADIPPVKVHPPVIFLGGLVVGCFLAVAVPVGPGLARGAPNAFWVGLVFTLLGLGFSLWSVREVVKAGSHVPTWQPTVALVTGGPYRLSRNPNYIGMLTLFFGVAVMLTNPWMLLVMPAMIWALQDYVIEPEEAFLARRFGAEYEAYARRVPRWM